MVLRRWLPHANQWRRPCRLCFGISGALQRGCLRGRRMVGFPCLRVLASTLGELLSTIIKRVRSRRPWVLEGPRQGTYWKNIGRWTNMQLSRLTCHTISSRHQRKCWRSSAATSLPPSPRLPLSVLHRRPAPATQQRHHLGRTEFWLACSCGCSWHIRCCTRGTHQLEECFLAAAATATPALLRPWNLTLKTLRR